MRGTSIAIDVKWASIRFARRHGWTVRRFDPWATLPDYLHHIRFPTFGVNCVLDVGAHRGEFAQILRDVGYGGNIVSFEPVFAGAGRCLDHVPLLQSEMSVRPIYEGMPDFRDALAVYEERGYAMSALYPVGRDQYFRLAEFDCVLVRTA